MNDALMEELLREGESSSLDYKREQYPFAGASDEEKGELLKDILAFANSWRHAEAYVLVGIEEIAGGRSCVVGVSNHIPENDLQQFVNSKTNRPVVFSYRAYPFEGQQIGIITIPQQERPVYLTKDYGKLKKHLVYYRQGTSTAIATPDDIARMGSRQSAAAKEASLIAEFADPIQDLSLGNRVSWIAEYCRMPDQNQIPTVRELDCQTSRPVLGRNAIPGFPSIDLFEERNDGYYRDRAEYEFCKRLFRKLRLVVSNTGDVPASEVRIELTVPRHGIVVMPCTKFPNAPQRRIRTRSLAAMRDIALRQAFRRVGDADIHENDHRFKIDVDCGNLQPGRQVWSNEFCIGIRGKGEIEMEGLLLAANLSGPKKFKLSIDADVSETEMSVEELVALPDPVSS